MLFVEGKEAALDKAFGGRLKDMGFEVRRVRQIPLDRRRRFKPGYASLRTMATR